MDKPVYLTTNKGKFDEANRIFKEHYGFDIEIKNPDFEVLEIQADDYLILCHDTAVDELSNYGKCYPFSSFQITNSGTNLTLVDKDDNHISHIHFDISWHDSNYKKEGGWSLEQIDAHNPCAGKSNWGSSVCDEGGTPGKSNSIKK